MEKIYSILTMLILLSLSLIAPFTSSIGIVVLIQYFLEPNAQINWLIIFILTGFLIAVREILAIIKKKGIRL